MKNQNNERFRAYLLWLKERGLQYPQIANLSPSISHLDQVDICIKKHTPLSNQCELLYIFSDSSTHNNILLDPELELLKKMLAAIQLDLNQNVILATLSVENIIEHDSKYSWFIKNCVPKLIVVNDLEAFNHLTSQQEKNWNQIRGKFFKCSTSNLPLMATWHPQKLLSHVPLKREAWEDLQNISKLLNKKA